MIEQEDLDLASIIGVNDSGTGIDEIFHRESASGSDAAVCYAKRKVRRDLVDTVSKSASNMCEAFQRHCQGNQEAVHDNL